jgi:hypothetical protein
MSRSEAVFRNFVNARNQDHLLVISNVFDNVSCAAYLLLILAMYR